VISVNERIAWLAGIADGEGSFFLTATKRQNGQPCVKYSFAVGNTNLPLILEAKQIVEKITGHQLRYHMMKLTPRHKQGYLLQVTSIRDLVPLCQALMPYLIAKRQQCELMLQFCALGKASGNQWSGQDMESFEKRRVLVSKMKHLNRVGRFGRDDEHLPQQETERLTPTTDEETVRSARRLAEVAETTTRIVH